ncbi:MAG: ADOP family duplicated permease [Terriglobia bacterium]
MRWHRELAKLGALFRRRKPADDLAEEIRSHLALEEQENVESGMAPEEAHYAALRRFGNVTLAQERSREMWGWNSVAMLGEDLRYGFRMLRKSPGVTAVVVIALALGVGANTAIFGIVNGFLLRPLPVPSPEQITVLAIQQKDAPVGSGGFSYPEFVDFRGQASAFSDIFGVVLGLVQFTADERSDQCFANYVSGNFFSSLGVRPEAGRMILPGEGETPGQAPFVVLDYAYWQKRFHGDPGIVGRQVRINGQPAMILGVAPRQFHGMFSIFKIDVYLPLGAMSPRESSNLFWNNRDYRRILAFGRLRPGTSLREAQSSLDVITARLAHQYPATDRWYTVRAVPEKSARPIPYANTGFVTIAGLFVALAGFVLLLACMNVENILLARGAARQREMGIRAALGAGRARLMCQTLIESLLLAILGGGAGVVLGAWADYWIRSIHLQNIPLQFDATLDWRVFTFGTASVFITGILVGLLPALRASSADVNSVLHEGARRDSRTFAYPGLRNLLVIGQVAGSLVLLVAAGLFVRSLIKVQGFDLGFDPDHVLNVIIDPQEIGYDELRTAAFYREIEARTRTLPGVQSVSLASYVPMGGFPSKTPVSVEGRPIVPGQQAPRVLFNCIDPPYFLTLQIPLLRGRAFTDSDGQGAPRVAIINQTMAQRFWPHQDPIGKRFSMNGDAGPFARVVGVTADGKYGTLGEDPQPFLYVPLTQHFVSKRALQIRTHTPPERLAAPVKGLVASLAPDLSIIDIETMKQFLEGALGFFAFRLAATLAAVLGTAGLILAVVGVYGVVSFTASRRTRDVGIRMALGARSRDILNLVWLQGVRLVMAGLVIGTLAAWALTRAMTHMVTGISTNDPLTYIVVAVLLGGVALLACWIPAWRAMKADPLVVLRHE